MVGISLVVSTACTKVFVHQRIPVILGSADDVDEPLAKVRPSLDMLTLCYFTHRCIPVC